MARFRKVVALGMCLWLLCSGSAAHAVASLEVGHERDHIAAAQQVHHAADHHHVDTVLELFSELFEQPGFEQLTSAWIAARGPDVSHDVSSVASVCLITEPVSATTLPPPGPPPRAALLNRGGGFSR